MHLCAAVFWAHPQSSPCCSEACCSVQLLLSCESDSKHNNKTNDIITKSFLSKFIYSSVMTCSSSLGNYMLYKMVQCISLGLIKLETLHELCRNNLFLFPISHSTFHIFSYLLHLHYYATIMPHNLHRLFYVRTAEYELTVQLSHA